MFTAAVVQLTSTSDQRSNMDTAVALIEQAAAAGAVLIATPENTNYLGPHDEKVRRAEPLEGDICGRFSELARRLGVYLLLGSYNEKSDEEHRCYNTSVLFRDDGEIISVYRKMHLFDVDHSDEVRFKESDTTKPGDEPAAATTDLGCLGLTICYDMRFPEMYRALTDQGAQILTVPSAFTDTTGKAHWYPLLRARAIETQCYVIAPAQHGHHDDQGLRESYGHSMIVDPWGQVIASASDGPGIALATIDLERVERIRRAMPLAEHRKI